MNKLIFLSIFFCQSVLADCYRSMISCIIPQGTVTIVYSSPSGDIQHTSPLDYYDVMRIGTIPYITIQTEGRTISFNLIYQVYTYAQEDNNIYIRYTDFNTRADGLPFDALFVYGFD